MVAIVTPPISSPPAATEPPSQAKATLENAAPDSELIAVPVDAVPKNAAGDIIAGPVADMAANFRVTLAATAL